MKLKIIQIYILTIGINNITLIFAIRKKYTLLFSTNKMLNDIEIENFELGKYFSASALRYMFI